MSDIPSSSPADRFNSASATTGLAGARQVGDDDVPVAGGDSISRLEAAQAKDRGTTAAVAPSTPPIEPAKTPTKPSVPGAPSPPPLEPEWKPPGKAAEHWDKLKSTHAAESATLKAQIATAREELATALKTGANPEEIKTLKEELIRYKETLKDVAIERDPEFKKRFEVREQSAISAAKLAAGDKASKLEELLKQPANPWRDEQINEIVEDLPTSAQRRVNAALGLLDQIDVERSAEIAQRRQEFDQRQAMTVQQQQAQQSARAQEFTKAFDAQLAAFTDPKAGHPFLTERPGDDAYNKGVASSKELASSLHKAFMAGELTHDDIAKAMLHVAVSERMMKTAQEALARAEKAEKALDRRRAIAPGDGRSGAPASDQPDSAPAPGSPEYMTWVTQRLAEAQAKDRISDMAGGRIV